MPVTLGELADCYRQASGDTAKLNICLRAVDAGHIAIGAPLENVRRLCGADFEVRLENEGVRYWSVVHLLPPVPGGVDDRGFVCSPKYGGWYLGVYHEQGVDAILGLVVTNMDKGMTESRPEHLTLDELVVCYRDAVAGAVKRDICLRAMDAGYITVGEPLANVRQLCGADFHETAGETRLRVYGVVRFEMRRTSDTRGRDGLHLVVCHERDRITDCLLSASDEPREIWVDE
jgi:hypothetical protein